MASSVSGQHSANSDMPRGRSLCGTHYALNFQCSVFRFRFFEGKEVGTALSIASD